MKIQTNRVFKIIERAKQQGFTTVSAQGSSRSGKTRNIVIWLILQCLNRPNITVSIVRSTLPSLKGSVLRDFTEVMLSLNVYDRRSFNKTDLVYTFPNGSMLEFFAAVNEQKLRGPKRDILFVNEANELFYIEFQQLQMRTTEFCIVDYNPSFSDEHWLCNLNQEEKTFHFITTYKDNPFLEQRVIDEIESLKWKNPSLWQIYGLGQQAVIEGLIFPDFKIIDSIPAYVQERCYVGMDFGYTNDPTAIVKVYINGDQLYIDEICYRTRMLPNDIIETLKENCLLDKIISESAEPRLVVEIYNAGLNIFPVKKFKGSIEAGLIKMQEYKIFVSKRSVNVIKEFKNYTYSQDKEGKWLNTPIDAFNHAIDAIRYVILEVVLGKGNPQTADDIMDILSSF
jgi:phage terminase large subunit